MVSFGIFFRYSVFLLLMITTGCAQVSQWARAFDTPASVGQFNFEWVIKGDKRVTPLQAFDDGRQTWLQFPSGTPVPAVFARRGEEDTLLTYRQSGPYVILPGVWSHLVIHGGHVQGHVYRQAEVAGDTGVENSLMAEQAATSVVPDVPAIPVEVIAATEPLKPVIPVERGDTKPVNTFKVGPADGTMREALAQWARFAQWDFGPEHWAVDVDIPIVGSAQFDTSFEEAVRSLVASSELGDRPLQPCFYSNRVLRIVPFAQPCDRARKTMSAS
ncbi:TrbG/VirB9 family P-type conjugative transfer protein [Pusillimonas sp. DMV24BSW_D]|uniref:TcpQ domain-containing protein n=1 Tax=Neopusillimonas aestuarii TaxID=2716226 RepID=UPI00140CDEC2|nr:TcpQ domain-containing protein [Pusillimonas sp. DMV24BSW_D]QIM49909.1 TrbG/VirB9 family P-type conjugative transfer protein [Pusillimonas sp. DMV24BSW_D]